MQDPERFYNDVWNGFENHIETFRDHWSAHEEWERQEGQYSLFLKVPPGPLNSSLQRAAESLRRPYFQPLTTDELHVTLMSIAPTHDVLPEELAVLTAAILEAGRAHKPFKLRIGGLNALEQSVFAEIRPWDKLVALRQDLRAAAVSVLGEDGVMAPQDFYAHMALGYINEDVSTAELLPTIASMRNRHFGDLDVTGIDLVYLRREGHHYRDNSLVSISLDIGGRSLGFSAVQ